MMSSNAVVKMRTTMAGPWGTGKPGQVVSLPAAVARELCAAGYADEVKGREAREAVVETAAMADAPETTAKRGPGRPRKKLSGE